MAMDPEMAERLAALPEPEHSDLTPLGYSPMVARVDLLIDHLAETHATLAQLVELTARRKAKRRPVKHQPRPVTAIEKARKRSEIDEMREVAAKWFGRNGND